MLLPGFIVNEEREWVVIVDALGAYGQGKTREAACAMTLAIIHAIADDDRPLAGFRARMIDGGADTVYVTANDSARLVSMVLRCERDNYRLTLADAAKRMGARSTTSYAAYEQGKNVPTIGKLEQLLGAVAPELVLAIVPRTATITLKPEPIDSVEEEAFAAFEADQSPANLAALDRALDRDRERRAKLLAKHVPKPIVRRPRRAVRRARAASTARVSSRPRGKAVRPAAASKRASRRTRKPDPRRAT